MKIIWMICLSFFMAYNIHAQEHRSKEERIKAIKLAFITEELALSPQQSQDFWPLYNELQEKLRNLRRKLRRKQDFDNMSDEAIEAFLEEHLRLEEEKIKLQRAYIQKFKKVISLQQIVKLTKAEHRFRKELLKKAKERREGQRHQRGH